MLEIEKDKLYEIIGINTIKQLKELEELIKNKKNWNLNSLCNLTHTIIHKMDRDGTVESTAVHLTDDIKQIINT